MLFIQFYFDILSFLFSYCYFVLIFDVYFLLSFLNIKKSDYYYFDYICIFLVYCNVSNSFFICFRWGLHTWQEIDKALTEKKLINRSCMLKQINCISQHHVTFLNCSIVKNYVTFHINLSTHPNNVLNNCVVSSNHLGPCVHHI